MKIINLTKGAVTKVDDKDYEMLTKHSWSLSSSGYAIATIHNKHVLMHRFIIKPISTLFVDHIDGDRLNNQRLNLRLINNSQNVRNQKVHKNNTSGYKGVSYRKDRGKYRAYICYNRKQIQLGYFDTPIEAALAYNKSAIFYFGQYANLNVIEGVSNGDE